MTGRVSGFGFRVIAKMRGLVFNDPMIRSLNHPVRCLAALVLVTIACAGCSTPWVEQTSRLDTLQVATFDAPPKRILEVARQTVSSPPLSLGVEKEDGGTILTGYHTGPGEWHVARRWQERTRYRITVIPDFDRPNERGRIEVVEETQQRTTEGAEWKSAPELTRPERAAEVLKQIRAKVEAAGTTKAG